MYSQDFSGGPVDTNLPADAGDSGLIPGLGRFHMLWDNLPHVPQLRSLYPRAGELPLLKRMA